MVVVDRRTLLAGGAASAGLKSSVSFAANASPEDFTAIPVWPDKVPGAEKVTVKQQQGLRTPESGPDDVVYTHIVNPTLSILRPAKPNGAALLIIPGGRYVRVVIAHEGYAMARHFAAQGYTCFVLLYRMPGDGWAGGAEAPLQDAQRALRLVRSFALQEKFDAERIGVLGFSAGGHLAAWLTTRSKESYRPLEAIDQLPAKAAIGAYIYPVIKMDAEGVHLESRTQLLGEKPSMERMRAYSMDRDVMPEAPPAFLAHAIDDPAVPVENSIAMLAGLRARNIPAECHLFENGGHGFGITAQARSAALWPELFLAFAKRHGV